MATTTDATDLHAALQRVDIRLQFAVATFRDELNERARDPFRGLYISDSDVESLLASAPVGSEVTGLLSTPVASFIPRLAQLAQSFGLDAFDQEVLLICLAPEIDPRYERLFGYLHDDVTRRRPTIDLIARILKSDIEERVAIRQRFGPHAALMQSDLLRFIEEATQSPRMSRGLRLDEHIVDFLLGSDELDDRLSGFTKIELPSPDRFEPIWPGRSREQFSRLLNQSRDTRSNFTVYLYGSPGAAKLDFARAASVESNVPLMIVDVAELLSPDVPSDAFDLIAREGRLIDAILCFNGVDRLLTDDPAFARPQRELRRLLEAVHGPSILVGEARWEPAVWLPDRQALAIEVPPPDSSTRFRYWRHHLNGHGESRIDDSDLTDIAGQFHLDAEGVRAAMTVAVGRASLRGDDLRVADLYDAARSIAAPRLDGLALRIQPRYGWDDIVLTRDGMEQLRELCARARHQRLVLDEWGFGTKHARRGGLTALFSGPPGTGKTMAAEIIAGDLGLDVYRIDLSGVVSKYIGETEKNLERIFHAADRGDAVLLFDEADALFGKRSETRDAHDRYANVEIAYLLQRLEAYQGVAVLTTNLRGNVDEAFTRRIDFVVEFPIPDEQERLDIWKRAVPIEAPVSADVDLAFLARKFRLAGGHIRNIALAAAFLAATDGELISMKHLVRATRREHQKLLKMISPADFNPYHHLFRD